MVEVKTVDIRRAAMDLLARREHSLQELTTKLVQKLSRRLTNSSGFSEGLFENNVEPAAADECDGSSLSIEEMIDRELTRLVEENLQSDERFVESFINGRKAKGHGPHRIRRDLNQKQVSEYLIEQYLDESGKQWIELAEKVYLKKFGVDPPLSYQEKAKRLRFMQQRGFPPWMVAVYFR